MADGSKRQKELELDPKKPLPEGLRTAFEQMIDYAKSMVDEASDRPDRAVHEFRRSLNRARAQLKLSGGWLRGRARGWLEESVTAARKKTGGFRDVAALQPVVEALAGTPQLDRARVALQALLSKDGESLAAGAAAATLDKNARNLAGLAEIYASALRSVDDKALRASFEASIDKAKSAFKRAKKTKDIDDVHVWRKAVKDVRYQLELVAGRLGDGAELRRVFIAQAKALGEITDLAALKDYVKTVKSELGTKNARNVRAFVDKTLDEQLDAAFGDAKRAFRAAKEALKNEASKGSTDKKKAKKKDAEAPVPAATTSAATGKAPAAKKRATAPRAKTSKTDPEAAAKKPATPASTANKTTTRKAPAKKAAAARKPAAKKATTRRTAAKTTAAAKKTTARKATAAKKTTARKATAAKKTTARKATTTKKAAATRKPAAKRAAAKKPATKRTTAAKKRAASTKRATSTRKPAAKRAAAAKKTPTGDAST